jgi:FkbH-like protein
MRILKLVIWDLDETLLTGIFVEGDEEVDAVARHMVRQLHDRGILQALATQNPPELAPVVLEKFGWANVFVRAESDLRPKVTKVRRIIDSLAIDPRDVVFVDEDPFERDSVAVQVPDITAMTIAELAAYLENASSRPTEESRRRPQMYREHEARHHAEQAADDYLEFLRSCNILITIRAYRSEDASRAQELLTRTHQMNLGVLPIEEAIARLHHPGEQHVIVGEIQDIYGDFGRCGLLHLRPDGKGEAVIDSLAISCRTRARGLSLALLVGLLRHSGGGFRKYRCRYVYNGSNRPLRMLLLGAGFKHEPGSDELILQAEQLNNLKIPDWVQVVYEKECNTPVESHLA